MVIYIYILQYQSNSFFNGHCEFIYFLNVHENYHLLVVKCQVSTSHTIQMYIYSESNLKGLMKSVRVYQCPPPGQTVVHKIKVTKFLLLHVQNAGLSLIFKVGSTIKESRRLLEWRVKRGEIFLAGGQVDS